MKVRLIKDVETTNGPMKAGEIIDHLMAHTLITLGMAEEITEEPKSESEPSA